MTEKSHRQRVTIKLTADEHALCVRAAEPSSVVYWMREIALREARSRLEPIDPARFEKYALEELRDSLATLREGADERLLEALTKFERGLWKVLDHLERTSRLLTAASEITE